MSKDMDDRAAGLDNARMTTTTEDLPIDAARVEAFAGQLVEGYTRGMVTLMIDLGHRAGLFEALSGAGPLTSAELAERAGCDERYVREWLGAVATGGIVDHDGDTLTYTLPAEHALLLTGHSSMNLAMTAGLQAHLGKYVGDIAEIFRTGGGLPYARYRPEFTELMDQEGRFRYDECLVDLYLPLAEGLVDQLRAGARVADFGCGTGHCINIMAAAFPASEFVGYDLATDAIERAQAEAAEMGLTNATFEARDVLTIPAESGFDTIFAFDSIHDQVDPAGVLACVRAALRPGGTFVMLDIKAHSAVADNLDNPIAPMLYTISTLHCMTVSLAHDGAGLGTAWGEETARRMLAEAGFTSVSLCDLQGDPFNSLYVCR
jgi:SAM-dependent methyltransferase